MLPSFEMKTMYNGMELGKRYTPKELGCRITYEKV